MSSYELSHFIVLQLFHNHNPSRFYILYHFLVKLIVESLHAVFESEILK